MKLSDVFYALGALHSKWGWDDEAAAIFNKIGDALDARGLSL